MGGRGVACRFQSHATSRWRGRGCGAGRLWRPVVAASPMVPPGLRRLVGGSRDWRGRRSRGRVVVVVLVACGALVVVAPRLGDGGSRLWRPVLAGSWSWSPAAP
jgi:hypothetical protein